MRTNGFLAFCALLAAPQLAGCGSDFAPYSELDRLRVLAIAATPPTPLTGQTALISPLVFAPGDEAVAYHWTWCPADAPASKQFVCSVDESAAAQLLSPLLDPTVAPALPSLDLGVAATAQLNNPFSPVALAALCAAGLSSPPYAQAFDCDGGFPVTVVLDVATASASLRAGFVLRLPVGEAPELNQNPTLGGLVLAGVLLDDPAGPIAVRAGQPVDLTVEIPPTAAEVRPIPASEGPPGQRLERLTASWFADAGTLDKARTAFIDGQSTLAETANNRWTAPTADAWPAGGRVELAVVLRDDRGGVAWLVRHALLEQSP